LRYSKHFNNIQNQTLQNTTPDTYIYEGSQVTIITVFSDNNGSIALVEDENGKLFEVSRDALI